MSVATAHHCDRFESEQPTFGDNPANDVELRTDFLEEGIEDIGQLASSIGFTSQEITELERFYRFVPKTPLRRSSRSMLVRSIEKRVEMSS